ncbi:MAG: hypothetical protein QXQ64_06190 [Candidatus Bathyarchaeia archaeon]
MSTLRYTIYEGTFEVDSSLGYTEKSLSFSFNIPSKTTILSSKIDYSVNLTKSALQNVFVIKFNDVDVAKEEWYITGARGGSITVSPTIGTNTVKLVFGRNSGAFPFSAVWDVSVHLTIEYEGEPPTPVKPEQPLPLQILIYAIVAAIILGAVAVMVKVIRR